jgi:regulator of nonsense transcripts 2
MIGTNSGGRLDDDDDSLATSGGKWEDEEERRFFEDIQDLKDFVPKSVLGLDVGEEKDANPVPEKSSEEQSKIQKEKVEADIRKLEEELAGLDKGAVNGTSKGEDKDKDEDEEEEECVGSLS